MDNPDYNLRLKSNFKHGTECLSFVSEELEAEEDELRRNEEIKEMMQNAFDDLDDDCHSVNSSSYLASLSGCCNSKTTYSEPSPWNQMQTLDEKNTHAYNHMHSDEGNYVSQIEKLQTELEEIRKQFKEEKSEWMDKFFREEEEKKLAMRKNEEINTLFCESQMKLLQRENELEELSEKLQQSERTKKEALEEVKSSKEIIKQLEQRLVSQEQKNSLCTAQTNDPKNTTEEQKSFDYEQKIQDLAAKLASKEKKCRKLEQQLQELHDIHKSVVAEKSNTIAKLIVNLEKCQSQCHKLMLNSHGKSNGNDNSIGKFKVDARQSLPVNFEENPKLIDELCRAYSDLKEKTSEIKLLQEQLKSCVKQIKSDKESELKYITDTNSLKDKLSNLEEKNSQLETENRQLKSSISNYQRESVVDHSDDNLQEYLRRESQTEIASLNKKLGTSFEQCDTLKKMYLDVSTAKEKLLLQNQQLKTDLEKLKTENITLNGIIKSFNKDPQTSVNYDSFAQESVYLQYSPPDNNDLKYENLQSNYDAEDLKSKLKICEEKLQNIILEHAKQLEVLRVGVQEYIMSTEVQHQKQIDQLEEDYSKKILELESKHQEQFYQFENQFKDQVLKVSTEEIKNLSNIFQKHLDNISETVDRLQHELKKKDRLIELFDKQLENANLELQKREEYLKNIKSKHELSSEELKEQINLMNERQEKLILEIEKIYNKYKNARKAAIDLKQMLDVRSQLLLQHQQFYAQTLNEIQNYLNDTLDCKPKGEKSITNDISKEDLIAPDDEINAAIMAIKKQLESLRHRR